MMVVLTLVTTHFSMVLGNSFITSSTLRLRALLFFIGQIEQFTPQFAGPGLLSISPHDNRY